MNGFLTRIFAYPFGYVIGLLYNLFGQNYLLAIIFFAVVIKLALLPTGISQQKNQVKTKRMQAKIQKIREKYGDDQKKIQEETAALYQKEGMSTMTSGCGSLLIQLPIIFGLYGAIYNPLTYVLRLNKGTVAELTSAVGKLLNTTGGSKTNVLEIAVLQNVDKLHDILPNINQNVFATISDFAAHFKAFGYNFGTIPKDVWRNDKMIIIVPIVAFASSMLTSIYSLIRAKKMDESKANMASMGCMMLFMPLMSLWLAWQFPVGIGIYWAVNGLLGFVQMVVLNMIYTPEKVIAKMMLDETITRREKEVSFKNQYNYLNEKN